LSHINLHFALNNLVQEEFEDTKEVIKIYISKKNRQHILNNMVFWGTLYFLRVYHNFRISVRPILLAYSPI